MKAIKYKNPKSIQGMYSLKLNEFIFKLLSKHKADRPFTSELFTYFPSSFTFKNLIDINNYNSLVNSEDKTFKKNVIDKGLEGIDSEFIALKNRQLIQKFNFTQSFKKRNMQLTTNLADVFQNTANRRREHSIRTKDKLGSKPKMITPLKYKSDNVLNILKSKVRIHNDEDDSLSRDSDTIFHTITTKNRNNKGRHNPYYI